VAYAAAGAGIRVPRTALEQWHSGIAVPRRAVQAGDLIFMHLAHKELHVGIALGDQRFIHAPSKGGACASIRSPPRPMQSASSARGALFPTRESWYSAALTNWPRGRLTRGYLT